LHFIALSRSLLLLYPPVTHYTSILPLTHSLIHFFCSFVLHCELPYAGIYFSSTIHWLTLNVQLAVPVFIFYVGLLLRNHGHLFRRQKSSTKFSLSIFAARVPFLPHSRSSWSSHLHHIITSIQYNVPWQLRMQAALSLTMSAHLIIPPPIILLFAHQESTIGQSKQSIKTINQQDHDIGWGDNWAQMSWHKNKNTTAFRPPLRQPSSERWRFLFFDVVGCWWWFDSLVFW